MATDTRTAAPTQATDANFRLWITAVKNALVAAGLTQQADTGVINYTTVTRPTVGSSIKGFDIFKFSDTLQATKPVFIKVEYGSGTAATNPQLTFTFGTGTDGAGTITGPASPTNPTMAGMPAMTASTTVRTMYAAGVAADGWFNFVLWPGLHDAAQNSSHTMLYVERTRDASGNPTGDGLMIYQSISENNYFAGYYLDFNLSSSTFIYALCPSVAASGISGADVYLTPYFPPGVGVAGVPKTFPPGMSILAYLDTDITKNTSITVSMYGSNRTYKCLGNWHRYAAYNIAVGWTQAMSVAMRWE